MNGPVCLDLSSIRLYFKRCGVKKSEFDDVFDALHVMESEALRVMSDEQRRREMFRSK